MSWPRYEGYKLSGLAGLAEVPSHWRVEELRRTAAVYLSNVDKKSVEGEAAVRLCNYTDVYYNDRITLGIEFMTATATAEQRNRFQLQIGGNR